jgi:hypothetical protein
LLVEGVVALLLRVDVCVRLVFALVLVVARAPGEVGVAVAEVELVTPAVTAPPGVMAPGAVVAVAAGGVA